MKFVGRSMVGVSDPNLFLEFEENYPVIGRNYEFIMFYVRCFHISQSINMCRVQKTPK